eukprot:TRINITY_DN46439_c0_g1_i1.p1 TRINITY_DN46439_c0_g1~~TRINITY_DN46439_c0_g1_i1.p1  ORF type:complete len:420 (+),score=92.61 TRINITY_DN46439_c0_g1_i1:135-1262(+)
MATAAPNHEGLKQEKEKHFRADGEEPRCCTEKRATLPGQRRRRRPHLVDFDIAENHIGPRGALAIAKLFLRRDFSVRQNDAKVIVGGGVGGLGLSNDEKARPRTADKLQVLDLQDNRVGATGAQALAEALHPYMRLRGGISCDSDENGSVVSTVQFESPADGLGLGFACFTVKRPPPPLPSLERLILAGNRVEDAGAMPFAAVIEAGAAEGLRFLDLRCNGLGDLSVRALAQALQRTKAMESVALAGNIASEEMQPYLPNLCRWWNAEHRVALLLRNDASPPPLELKFPCKVPEPPHPSTPRGGGASPRKVSFKAGTSRPSLSNPGGLTAPSFIGTESQASRASITTMHPRRGGMAALSPLTSEPVRRSFRRSGA